MVPCLTNTKIGLAIRNSSLFIVLMLTIFLVTGVVSASNTLETQDLRDTPSPRDQINLEKIPLKILYETYRQTDDRNNWELFLINADGSNPVK